MPVNDVTHPRIIAPPGAHFLLLIGIAAPRARRMRNMSGCVLGARRLGGFTTALSTGSSTTSAWTMPSLPALAYVGGALARWNPASAVIGIWLSWTLLAAIGCLGAAIPVLYPESIFDFVSYARDGMGTAFGPVAILALYWRRFSRWSAIVSTLAGTLVAPVWELQSGGPGGVRDVRTARRALSWQCRRGCRRVPRPRRPRTGRSIRSTAPPALPPDRPA